MEDMDFSFREMQEMQKELQEKYRDKWRPLSPEQGKDQLLWMIIEAGEMADIMKKEGVGEIMENPQTRIHFIEEMADVLMYYNDIMLCYGISIEDFKEVYLKKHRRNMERW